MYETSEMKAQIEEEQLHPEQLVKLNGRNLSTGFPTEQWEIKLKGEINEMNLA